MSQEPDLFAAYWKNEAEERQRKAQMDAWLYCWNWSGPQIGRHISVAVPIAEKADGSGGLYCYMERAKVLELNQPFAIVELDNTSEVTKAKNGTKLKLDYSEIWPSVINGKIEIE